MATSARQFDDEERELVLVDDDWSIVTPLVYSVVAIGLTTCLAGLLLARAQFDTGTMLLALLLATPFLLYARLALTRPGAASVISAVLLLGLGTWGAIDAATSDIDPTYAFVRLPILLVVVQVAVFAAASVLRPQRPARERARPPRDPA